MSLAARSHIRQVSLVLVAVLFMFLASEQNPAHAQESAAGEQAAPACTCPPDEPCSPPSPEECLPPVESPAPTNPYPRPNDAIPCEVVSEVVTIPRCYYVSDQLPGRPTTLWVWAADFDMATDVAGRISGTLGEGVMMNYVPSPSLAGGTVAASSSELQPLPSATRTDHRVIIQVRGDREHVERWQTFGRLYREQGRICANANFHLNTFPIKSMDTGCGTAACGYNDYYCASYFGARYSQGHEFFDCGDVLSNTFDTAPPNEIPGQPRIGICG